MAQLYLKFEGKGHSADIDGTVERPNYKACIAIDSFSFGASHMGDRPTLSQADASIQGNAQPGEIIVSKVAGQESPGLLTCCLKGTIVGKATVTMDGSSDDAVATPIMTYVMEPVVVKSITQGGGSGGGAASIGESVSLSYDKITVTHVPSKKIATYQQSTTAMK
jgi:type VI protein secretion system component Hcp